MKIAFLSSECVPFAKTGGLADVAGTLPRWIHAEKHDIRVFMPKYRQITPEKYKLTKLNIELSVPMPYGTERGDLYQSELPGGCPVYCIDHKTYFNREFLYGTPNGDYADNDERFIFFSKAVLEALKRLSFIPDIIHCNDWQTGLVPAYIKTIHAADRELGAVKCVFTVHNIAYQGVFDKMAMEKAGFPWELFNPEKLEYYDQLCFLKAGIVYADQITTVSPTYAKEIESSSEFGFGMEGVLAARARDLSGIINGIDYDEWNPAADAHIARHFTIKEMAGKQACKHDLQQLFPMKSDPHIPLFGIVSRLAAQKGLDILADALDILHKLPLQIIILGTGDIKFMTLLEEYAQKYPQFLGLSLKFDNGLAHKIYAGCDFFLMPSKYEPCGLGQMIAMRYGTIPVVMKTGGLADTVVDYGEKPLKGNGVCMNEYSASCLVDTVRRAVLYGENPRVRKAIMSHIAKTDFTWKASAKKYIKLYQKALKKKN
jgi:starch synthase